MDRQIVFRRTRSKQEEWISRHSLKTVGAMISVVILLILLAAAPRIHAGDSKGAHAPPGIRVMELRSAPRQAVVDAP